jgi:tetratricopeptide (TPR) repeat protein
MGTRLDSVLVVDYRRSLDGIPEEVVSLLPLFDGNRSAREALKKGRVPDAHAVELVERLRRLGVLAESVDDPEGPELAEWLKRPQRSFSLWWIGAGAALLLLAGGFLLIRSRPLPATSAVALAPVVAPPAPVVAPEPVAAPQPVVAPPVVAPEPPVAPPIVTPPTVAPKPPVVATDEYPRLIRDARSLLDRGAYEKALAAATRASEARPESAEPYLVIGTVEQQNGRVAQATAAYKRYLALAPKGAYASEIRSILRTLH